MAGPSHAHPPPSPAHPGLPLGAWLEVTHAEYRTCCGCRKYFRTWPLDVPPKASYDAAVRQAVLDRLLLDQLNVEQTKAALRRDYLLSLSDGFVYDCLRWHLACLDLAGHRQEVVRRFSGTLCVDEPYLGACILLLVTDLLADRPVGFALIGANDQDHLRRFLHNLDRWDCGWRARTWSVAVANSSRRASYLTRAAMARSDQPARRFGIDAWRSGRSAGVGQWLGRAVERSEGR